MIAVYKKFFLMLGVTVLLCLSASLVWSETIKDLVKRNGVFYKKFTDLPFNGKITGEYNGSFKNGLPDGYWVAYHENGQIWYKGILEVVRKLVLGFVTGIMERWKIKVTSRMVRKKVFGLKIG